MTADELIAEGERLKQVHYDDPEKSGLTLMTCAGDVMPRTRMFSERVAVFAEED